VIDGDKIILEKFADKTVPQASQFSRIDTISHAGVMCGKISTTCLS